MISIIIPVLNEETGIVRLLDHLKNNSSFANNEILIVDGGSTDQTPELVKKYSGVVFLASEKGRAKQMNTGAKNAKFEILYFLHADSFPPPNFDQLILKQINAGNSAGCFQMKFDMDHWWLNLMGWFTKFNHKACRGGDQSLFITKSLFKELNGYNETFVVYEDNEFIGRLYKQKEFEVIPESITTSARKYEEIGVWKLQFCFANIYLKRLMGATPEELHQYYKRRINP
ncbi:TIGR04283 family arsenosugar biosynthesis glycosyltransferase [Gillisia marina]|uniref:TIGR04283 family arsenosugar biosynthesis glycosyltransferase n=1 Tax=Gillisia marina TaxID=1167637 RepID=UPI00029B45B7|nr:TIGR04283 family arsenosugar biosynthesis glycosyltransferase [Gillisia marina]